MSVAEAGQSGAVGEGSGQSGLTQSQFPRTPQRGSNVGRGDTAYSPVPDDDHDRPEPNQQSTRLPWLFPVRPHQPSILHDCARSPDWI